nr:MAG TPA: hypothetical protein [Caudoviricetes sp.]
MDILNIPPHGAVVNHFVDDFAHFFCKALILWTLYAILTLPQ